MKAEKISTFDSIKSLEDRFLLAVKSLLYVGPANGLFSEQDNWATVGTVNGDPGVPGNGDTLLAVSYN